MAAKIPKELQKVLTLVVPSPHATFCSELIFLEHIGFALSNIRLKLPFFLIISAHG